MDTQLILDLSQVIDPESHLKVRLGPLEEGSHNAAQNVYVTLSHILLQELCMIFFQDNCELRKRGKHQTYWGPLATGSE